MAENNPHDPELQLQRKLLLTPCSSLEDLQLWCRMYLGLDFPDTRIDDSSTGSPMDTFWEVYDAGVNRRPLKMEDGSDARRMMMYASRDSYKCVQRGTKILTRDRGLQPIEGVRVGEVIWSGWAWRPVTDWVYDGIKEGVALELEDGHRLTVSPIHRVWTWSSGSMPTWKKVSELDVGRDLVMVDAPRPATFEQNKEAYQCGYVLGVLAGDGCTRFMNDLRTRKVCVTASDEVVRDAWSRFCVEVCGRAPKTSVHWPFDYWVNSTAVCDRLAEYGVTASYSYEKRAPHAAFSSVSSMAGFLSGFLDTDGTVTSKNNVEVPLTSRGLLEDALLMLNALGVQAYIRSNTRKYGTQKHIVHHLVIKAREFPAMARAGVVIRAVKAQVSRVRQTGTKDTHDGIPFEFVRPLLGLLSKDGGRGKRSSVKKPKVSSHYASVSREKLSALLDWAEAHGELGSDELARWRFVAEHKWVRPASVVKCESDFYDLTVDVDHSYWSNGVVSHNTLGASVLELLAMLHMDRNVVHLAAIEQQAGKAQEYLQSFLEKEGLDEFLYGNNKRTIAVLWFEHKDSGDILTNDEWKALDGRTARHDFVRHVHYVKVIVNTPQSANSDHTAFMVVDEVDLIRFPKAYAEAKLIPSTQVDVYGRRQPAITVLTSTRKSSGGLVQKEIDEAQKTKTLIRHWNVLDVAERCPDTRCRPDLVKVKVWFSDDDLRTLTPEDFKDLSTRDPKRAERYAESEAFAGCAKCSIFAACKGRLHDQKSKAGLLKDVADVIGKFDENSIEMAIAQLLCRKPGNEGAIYPRLSRETHMLDASVMWEVITGDPAPPGCNKAMLISLLQSRGATCVTGMDFGFTHCFAVVTGWMDGRRFFILDAFEIPGLELSQCVDLCDTRIKAWDPIVWPDVAYPAYITTFRKHGYRCRTHKKDVLGGIDAVRTKLMPVGSRQPEMFFLRGDEGCEHIVKRLVAYKWKLDQAGEPTDIPEEKDDDLCDAIRYAVQNTFQKSGKIVSTSREAEKKAAVGGGALQFYTTENWLSRKVQELTGTAYVETGVAVTKAQSGFGPRAGLPEDGRRVKKGSFFADFS